MNKLTKKIVVVTGGTSGIGEASVRCFAKNGARVIIAGRNQIKGEKIEQDIIEQGFDAQYCKLDVTDDFSVEKFIEKVVGKYKRIDALFNNAGIFPVTPKLENTTSKEWEKIFDVNTIGLYRVIKNTIPYLIESQGVILINASIAGLQSFSSGSTYAYSASKSAAIQFSRMLAKNYGNKIRINCICPGVVDTPIFVNRDFSRYEKNIPLGRVATSEDIAKVANFLISDDAQYINGAVIPIDGGMSL